MWDKNIYEDNKYEKLILENWDRHKRYLEDENRLIHERIGRTLVVHGFLLTAIAVIFRTMVDGADRYEFIYFAIGLLLFLSLVGAISAWSLKTGVDAAILAIGSVKEHYSLFRTKYGGDENLGLPGLTGGGNCVAESMGNRSVIWLANLMVLFWIVVLVLVITFSVIARENLIETTTPGVSAYCC